MQHKSVNVLVKAVGEDDGLEDGQFEAIVSVFGNRDSYGDVVLPGAFKDTLAEWASSGNPIPVYWSHRMDNPDYNIGHVLEAAELLPGDDRLPEALKDLGGLCVKVQVDLHEEAAKARQVYRLLKGRRVTQFSFAYDVLEGGWATREKAGGETEEIYELRKLKVYEVGPTPIGANQETELLAVKAAAQHAERFVADVKAGRVLSAKNETTLREALTSLEDSAGQIKNVLAALEPADDDSKAKASEPAKDEGPDGVKSEEPMHASPAALSALLSIELAAVGG